MLQQKPEPQPQPTRLPHRLPSSILSLLASCGGGYCLANSLAAAMRRETDGWE